MRLRNMTEQDIPAGLRLNTLAGWNQTARDWRRFLDNSPSGCFAMEHDGAVIGTAATIAYQDRLAWIGMVLVDPGYRKQGIGTRLLERAIDFLDRLPIGAAKLDATPLGKPLYEKLGFVPEYEIERWILRRADRPAAAAAVGAPLTPVGKERIYGLDRELFGADRGFLLRSLAEEAPEFAMAAFEGPTLSYAFGRHGLFADHLGPWVAGSRPGAKTLLEDFLARSLRDTLIVDAVRSHSAAVELLDAFGFRPSRPLTRMVRGRNGGPGRPDSLCAILGPEFG
jgi:GNAT superfamily N-acetyltransferase